MDNSDFDDEWFLPPDSSNIEDALKKTRVIDFIEQAHSARMLNLIMAICQIFLGITVVTISILGFIQPFWLSTFVSMIASVTTIIGLYFLYMKVGKSLDSADLLRRALKRVMESKN